MKATEVYMSMNPGINYNHEEVEVMQKNKIKVLPSDERYRILIV